MFTLLLIVARIALSFSYTFDDGRKTIKLEINENAIKYWTKNLAPPDLSDVEDEEFKQYFEHQYAQCIYDEEKSPDGVKVLYYWPFRAVEIPCLCDKDGFLNGKMKRWRYLPLQDDKWESSKWSDMDAFRDIKEYAKDFYEAFMKQSHRSTAFRVPPMFTQQDGLLVIYKAGLEVQGVYNCYDESTQNNIQWAYLLIAMAPPVAQPCYTMSEAEDRGRDVYLHQTNIFCRYLRFPDGNYAHEVDYPIDHLTTQYCQNAVEAPDVCSSRTNDTSFKCLKPLHNRFCFNITTRQKTALEARDKYSYINFGQQMVVFPYEAWQLAYNPVQYPLEKVEDNLLQRDSSQNEDYPFVVKMVWSPWSHCSACKPYMGWQTREGHCYFSVKSKDAKLPGDINSVKANLFVPKGYYSRNRNPSGFSAGVQIDTVNRTYQFEEGFERINLLLQHGEELKETEFRLMSSIFVDAFCGQGHGIANCSCLQSPYQYFFEKLISTKGTEKYEEKFRKHGLAICFDYTSYSKNFSDSLRGRDHRNRPKEVYLKSSIFTYAGGYYIEQRQCYADC
ncbi:hypothetical protein TTRE_0000409401 [Trichuris trichiura]|uniref:Uncharacterized protein n=1 Tax=Trichuris trichiura TaxID=36087 RepID=A0A077Z6K8_TRITR|nr:hypothetical protein TTRE_0000409401 [Trichuris trichiura]